MTIARQKYSVYHKDTTTAGAINARTWTPPLSDLPQDPVPLVIYCHQLGGTEQISPTYWAYPFAHATIQESWMFAASRAHGDNWGNTASQTDVLNLYNAMNAVHPVSSVVLIGSSMGGLDAVLVHANDLLPAGKVKGVYLNDAVLDLNWAYAQAGFTSSINTAFGVTAYNQIPAGFDPMTRAVGDLTDIRWRLSSSTADTTVAKASNTTPFVARLAGAPEVSQVSHNTSGHTSQALAADMVAFVKRCIA